MADIAAIDTLVLASKASNGYDAAFMAACVEELSTSRDAVEAGDVWVAQASALVGTYRLDLGDQAQVHMMFVAPATKGTGVGAALWRHMEARARAGGAKSLGLDADPFAEGFYRHMGMEIVGRSPSGSIPGRTLARMHKNLTDAGAGT
ncbi:MAG: GNAT family N-acetyltransferase [Alphaproteobacteria bacterium]